MTLIQRFGSALNLNIHFQMLFLDGVYVQSDSGHYGFRQTPPPTVEQLHELLHVISQRVARFLERRGILERDEDNSYLTLDGLEEDPLKDLHAYSVTYRVAVGSRLSEDYSPDRLQERLGEAGKDWVPLGAISPNGKLYLHTAEQTLRFREDWRLLYFAPDSE